MSSSIDIMPLFYLTNPLPPLSPLGSHQEIGTPAKPANRLAGRRRQEFRVDLTGRATPAFSACHIYLGDFHCTFF